MRKIDMIQSGFLAKDLLERGLRTSIVHLETGLSKSFIRDLYKDLYDGRSPSSGLMPSSYTMMASKPEHLLISAFAGIYLMLGGKDVFRKIDINVLIKAYDFFVHQGLYSERILDKKFDCTSAWVIARDIRSGSLFFDTCAECESAFIISEDFPGSNFCPSCSVSGRGRRSKGYGLSTKKSLAYLQAS